MLSAYGVKYRTTAKSWVVTNSADPDFNARIGVYPERSEGIPRSGGS
jgi:hypothetical protein